MRDRKRKNGMTIATVSPERGVDVAGIDDCGKTKIEPATILATAYPAVGKETQWEQALGELVRTSLSFPGHLGTTVLKPTVNGGGQYRIITKFDSIENMEHWRDSDKRQQRVAQIARYESKPADIHYVTGLETWFELPHHGEVGLPAPPKYKMAVIIWIAVYCAVLPLIAVLKPVFSPLPGLLGSALLAAVSVALMTWIVMPLLTVVFQFWLYPNSTTRTGSMTGQSGETSIQHVEH